jgi:hypothetical protein
MQLIQFRMALIAELSLERGMCVDGFQIPAARARKVADDRTPTGEYQASSRYRSSPPASIRPPNTRDT